jgi:hypothetical protein
VNTALGTMIPTEVIEDLRQSSVRESNNHTDDDQHQGTGQHVPHTVIHHAAACLGRRS